ncbi:hypothetical protein KQI82_11265 [Oscillibacter sp. MSJ-2]|uniref:DUF3192 domain-containing protein n=1 Tax=Dysosmobacter acutus TaxID=2841504 RepID=A0ABS6FB20_9FIRM|nr:hypothetical protein [Dysosmobacter acutus]MBU5627488.1 hypothetical protein [Dysosmobacter acutus]
MRVIKRNYLLYLAIVLAGLVIFVGGRLRPLRGLDASEIRSASVRCVPPDKEAELTAEQITELTELLRVAVVYQKDDSCKEYSGQSVSFTLEKADGTVSTVVAFSPFMAVDGVWYRAKQGPCGDLAAFGNQVLEGRN